MKFDFVYNDKKTEEKLQKNKIVGQGIYLYVKEDQVTGSQRKMYIISDAGQQKDNKTYMHKHIINFKRLLL